MSVPLSLTGRLHRALRGHRLDNMSQDSGSHCEKCRSDSRFSRGADDPPWGDIDEHRAQVAAAAVQAWLGEQDAEKERAEAAQTKTVLLTREDMADLDAGITYHCSHPALGGSIGDRGECQECQDIADGLVWHVGEIVRRHMNELAAKIEEALGAPNFD